MVAKRHRLARLEMGEARHDARGMFFGAVDQRGFERVDPVQRLVDRPAHEQFEIGRDLVVARARGVQPPAGSPMICDRRCSTCMNVFERGILDQLARLDFLGDLPSPRSIAAASSAERMPWLGEHRGVGAAGGDILAPQSLVDRDRGIYLAHHRGRAACKPPAPHLIGITRAADVLLLVGLLASAAIGKRARRLKRQSRARGRRKRARASTAATRARPRRRWISRSRRRRHQPRGLPRQALAGQSVGKLVRAVRQGIANARPAGDGTRGQAGRGRGQPGHGPAKLGHRLPRRA